MRRAGHWWQRAKVRARTRAAAHRRELDFAIEVIVTAGIIIVGLSVGAADSIDETSKIALAILLGTFEISFLFFRAILRRLGRLASDSLTVIPRDNLRRVLYEHLTQQRERLLDRAKQLSEKYDCELEKHEMYAELIGLTNIVAQYRAGYQDGIVQAVSSVNIEDFDEEPLAEAYLQANRDAVERHVVVRRLFILDRNQVRDRQVINIIHEHHAALTRTDPPGPRSGVKWVAKSDIRAEDHYEDFALFARDVLVMQALGGQRFELTQDFKKLERANEVFTRLWNHPRTRGVEDLVVDRRA